MLAKTIAPVAVAALLASVTPAIASTTVKDVKYTFYGYPDNDPPGAAIAYDCGRGFTAGGTGTHSDPLTFASAPGEFNKCEIIWASYLKKYIRMEDTCAQCTKDWENDGKWHVDIWTGSTTENGGSTQIDCEDQLTPDGGHDVVRSGSSKHTPNTGPLFADGTCYPGNTYGSKAAEVLHEGLK